MVKTDWTWKGMYQDLYDRAMKRVKNACMKFYDASTTLSLETNASAMELDYCR